MEEAFDGLIKFNRWLLIIDIILIMLFLYSWYRDYKKTGSYIDYWHYNMSMVFFIPILIMYPFSSSTINVFTVLGYKNLYTIEKYTTEAYVVTLIGFSSAYLGKYIFDKYRSIIEIEMLILPFSFTLGKFFSAVTSNFIVPRLFTIFYIFILVGFVIFIVQAGLLTNPREFFMINTQYRPIYTFILSTFDIVFVIISTRTLQYNKRLDRILFSILILFGFFLGVRAPIFLQGLSFGVLYVIYKKRGYISPLKITFVMIGTLFLVIFFAFVRNSKDGNFDFNIALQSFLPEIFYGNTFSDIRDFSWVLGYWNREHYWGLSYFAAILSFIPSSIYPIRDVYGIGKITVITAGLDPVTHPGLRMGMFGEMYLNFNVLGVVIFGFIWGYIQRRLDYLTKKFASEGNVIKASSVIVYSSFISYFAVSAGFWGLYITTFLLATLYFLTCIKVTE